MTAAVDQVFDEMYAALPANVQTTRAQAAVAAAFNVSLIAYEAGPGLVEDGVIGGGGATGAVTTLLIAAARDPRMQVRPPPLCANGGRISATWGRRRQ